MVGLSWISELGLIEPLRVFIRSPEGQIFASELKALLSSDTVGTKDAPIQSISAFVEWAIREQHLTSNQLFDHLKLNSVSPTLTSTFYQQPKDKMFWDSVRDEQPWTGCYFPLAQWDDHLIVGTCLPNLKLTSSRKIRLVNCRPSELIEWSQDFLKPKLDLFEQMHAASGSEPFSLSEGEPNTSHATAHVSDTDGSGEGENFAVDSEPSEPLEPQQQAPEGLILNFSLAPDPIPEVDVQGLDDITQPDTHSLALKMAQDSAPEVSSVLQSGLDEPLLVAPEPAQAEPQPALNDQPRRHDVSPVATDTHDLSQDEIARRHSVPINKLEPIHLDECRSLDTLAAQALLQTCISFEAAMIFLMKPNAVGQESLVPWKWTDLFLSIKQDQPDPIDLNSPSFFRTVKKTLKPYHGHVVDSPPSIKFFIEFYRGSKPNHVTMVPLIHEGRMFGLLLGCTNNRIEYRQSLRLMERLGAHVSRRFMQIKGTSGRSFPLTAA